MPENPFAKYKQPANPFAIYKTQGTGPKPPSGFGTPGNAPSLVPLPGGPDDLGYLSAKERTIQSIAAGIQASKSMQVNDHSTANELRANAIKNQQNANAPIPKSQQFDNIAQMRKELDSQNSVKVYKNALPSYASALKSPDTPEGDQDMIYAFAKIMDPNSVVREGEANSVADLGTAGQQIAGNLRKQLGGNGKFTPELRAQLRNTLANRVGMYNKAYNFERSRYRDLSVKQGIDPDLVVGPHMGDSVAAIENEYFRGDPNKSAAAARAEMAAKNGRTPPPGGAFDGPSSLPTALATGSRRMEADPGASALIDTLIRHGASADEINKSVTQLGFDPVDAKAVASAQAYLKTHPNYQGSFGLAQREVQNSLMERVASSGPGVGIGSAIDQGLGGWTDELGAIPASMATGKDYWDTVKQLNDKKQAAYAEHPIYAGVGGTIGSVADAAIGGALLKGGAMAAKLGGFAPYAGATAQGIVTGAGQNNENRMEGAFQGGALAPIAVGAGQALAVPAGALLRTETGQAAVNAARKTGLFGANARSPITPAPSLSPAEREAGAAITAAGPDNVRGVLDQAAGLKVPMSLADTAPQLRESAAAAVRRSPTAADVAESALLPRNRGQIDRFGNAVARDLGPIENIPQMSDDLGKSALANAKPLYEKSYAAGQVDDPAISTLLQHPEIRSAFNDAQQLHAQDSLLARARGEEPPPPLTQVVGPNGEYTPPDVRTIDYLQRALRGKADAAYSGDSAGKMSAPFLKDARNLLLSKTDAAVPEFAAARQAYGGPMQSKDALEFGQKAVGMNPNVLGLELGNMGPEQFGQAQIGFRSGLMDRADKVRYQSNPFDATLGTPEAEKRLAAMYPDHPGVPNLLAARDLEKRMADSSNAILGNSKTAQRQIADQAFAGGGLADLVGGAIDAAHGGVPVASIAKAGIKRAGLFANNKRKVAIAEELAPMVFNTDPAAAKQTVDDILKRMAERDAYVQRMRPTQALSVFGSGLGSTVPNYPRPF